MASTLDKLKSGVHKLKSGVHRVQEDLYHVKSGINKVVDKTAHTVEKISKTAKKFTRKKDTTLGNTSELSPNKHTIDMKDDMGKLASIRSLSETGGRIARNLANPRGQIKVAKLAYKEAKYALKQKKAELKAMKLDRKLQKAQKTKRGMIYPLFANLKIFLIYI